MSRSSPFEPIALNPFSARSPVASRLRVG
ncbi:MAG: hypothetical protein QOH38_347, partial [Thermoleophilaceae bacterium]|nr:hypothetical protein [Thermoleophilaceae bacterium]